MTKLLDADLLRAAEILEREAETIRASFSVNGKLALAGAEKRDHDEILRLAKRLRKAAQNTGGKP
ncbi:MAG: hypothetical protein ACYDB1_00655 [Acidiferrobacteraceae bacterium]